MKDNHFLASTVSLIWSVASRISWLMSSVSDQSDSVSDRVDDSWRDELQSCVQSATLNLEAASKSLQKLDQCHGIYMSYPRYP